MECTFSEGSTLPVLTTGVSDCFQALVHILQLSFLTSILSVTKISSNQKKNMTGSWKGRGNQYIEFARVLYCKLPTNGKQLPAFPHKALTGIEPRPQRWEARVLPLCRHGPSLLRLRSSYLNIDV